VRLAEEISRDTDGAFDVTVRPLVKAYRIGTDSVANTLTDRELNNFKPYIGYQHISIEGGRIVRDDPRIEIDLNAIAQGFTVDLLAVRLDSLGIRNYLVELGGEVFCRGVNAKGERWRVGIDRPVEGNIVPGENLQEVISLPSGRGLVTSGNYRKFAYDAHGAKVVHTIDPRTRRPAMHNLLSVTVLAPSAALADGYATACMVIGLEASKELLAEHPELEGYLIYAADDADGADGADSSSMQVYATPGLGL
jgi:thiamine biosynthesis lipoprotein